MADQSSIQSLLQQLAGTHTASQLAVPGALTPGNPNTIYNFGAQPPSNVSPDLLNSLTSPAVLQGGGNVSYIPQMPQGGYIPPQTDVFGNWTINPRMQPPAGQEPIDWSKMIGDIGGPMLPVWGGMTTPPPTQPPVITPNNPPPIMPPTGGPLPPIVTPGNRPPPPPALDTEPSCVVLESYIDGRDDRAANVRKGDLMMTINPKDLTRGVDTVTYAQTKPQPCVRIRTESGIELECSVSAPISDKNGNQVLAKNLKDVKILVMDEDVPRVEAVVSVEDIGDRLVRHITCGNKFFLAGKVKGKYIFHHNVKMFGPRGGTDRKAKGIGNPDFMMSFGGSTSGSDAWSEQFGAEGMGGLTFKGVSNFSSSNPPTETESKELLDRNKKELDGLWDALKINAGQAWDYIKAHPLQAGFALLKGPTGILTFLTKAGIYAFQTPNSSGGSGGK